MIIQTLMTSVPYIGPLYWTDAIAQLIKQDKVLAYQFEGLRFDCGTRIGLIKATIQFALDHEDLADEARAFMQEALARK